MLTFQFLVLWQTDILLFANKYSNILYIILKSLSYRTLGKKGKILVDSLIFSQGEVAVKKSTLHSSPQLNSCWNSYLSLNYNRKCIVKTD